MAQRVDAGYRRMVAAVLLVSAVAALSACERHKLRLTECVDGQPVVERTLDVAPPNC